MEIIANVGQPIIGSDFLAYYDLLLDMRRAILRYVKIGLTATGTRCYNQAISVKTVIRTTKFYKIIAEFPDIIQPGKAARVTKHSTQHHIQTTPGQAESCTRGVQPVVGRRHHLTIEEPMVISVTYGAQERKGLATMRGL